MYKLQKLNVRYNFLNIVCVWHKKNPTKKNGNILKLYEIEGCNCHFMFVAQMKEGTLPTNGRT